jgi:cytochrome c-type biogenesis protein CcmH/NrfG
MRTESIVFTVAGVFFGLIVGWIIGSQHAGPVRVAQSPVAQGPPSASATQPPRPLDEAQVHALRSAAQADPKNTQARVQLANLYFDAERYGDALTWYEDALRLDPKDVNVSTDLGVCYYYLDQPDKALQQFDRSLTIDPKHAKTMLNIGVVRAFGKQDLKGAAAAWQKLIEVAPESPEAQGAKKMLDSLKSAHPEIGGAAPATKGDG